MFYPNYNHGLSEETLRELNDQSNRNLLRAFDGDLKQIKTKSKKLLEEAGLIQRNFNNRGSKYWYTAAGEELLRELGITG